jgi:hypothetical protein
MEMELIGGGLKLHEGQYKYLQFAISFAISLIYGLIVYFPTYMRLESTRTVRITWVIEKTQQKTANKK